MEPAIEVVCDDPGHARGKVAKIETFRRYENPPGAGLWRASRTGRHTSGRELYSCKLCPASPVWNEDTLQRILESVWSHRAELERVGLLTPAPRSRTNIGACRVSLSTLNRVASHLPR